MDATHQKMVKTALQKLKKEGSGHRAFYFATDGERDILHVSSKEGDPGRFKDRDKINKHLKSKKLGAPLSGASSSCAGIVALHNGVLYFDVTIKKGVEPGELKKGLKGFKAAMKLEEYQIAEVPLEVKKGIAAFFSSPKRPTEDQLAASAQQLKDERRQEKAERQEEQQRLEDERRHDEEEREKASKKAKHQEGRLRWIKKNGPVFTGDPRSFSAEDLETLRGRIRSYLKDGGTEDLEKLQKAVRREARRREALREAAGRVEQASSPLLLSAPGLLAKAKSMLQGPVSGATANDIRGKLDALRTLQSDLQEQRDALSQAMSA